MFSWFRERHRNKKQFYYWFLTYLFVLLISVAISSSMYLAYSSILVQEIEKSTDSFLDKMKAVTELKLKSIESTGYNLMNTNAVNSIANSVHVTVHTPTAEAKLRRWGLRRSPSGAGGAPPHHLLSPLDRGGGGSSKDRAILQLIR